MTEPIAFTVVRFRCPTCPRTGSSKARICEHMARCWSNPEARGCKTCTHFVPVAEQCCGNAELNQCYPPACAGVDDSCDADVVLPTNDHGRTVLITGCERWEMADA